MTVARRLSLPVGLLGVILGADAAMAQVYPYGANPYHPAGAAPYGYYGYPQRGAGAVLQGRASVIGASGQYQTDIQQASMMREKVRQEKLETQRKRVQAEMQYEDMRKARYYQGQANERAAVLDRARNNPSNEDIWSGKTLNVLFKSVMMTPSSGPAASVALTQATLLGLNLTPASANGNLGLAKDSKIYWADALMAASCDDARNRFSSNFATAMKDARAGVQPDRALLGELRQDYKALTGSLDDRVGDLPPADYFAARRLLNQLKVSLEGLSDPLVIKSSSVAWKKDIRTVADLVAYCQNNGLVFSPAAALGDRAAYEAAYYAVRSYERETSQLASAK